MKVLVVSDTHGQDNNLIKILEKIGKIDLVIHLGDIEGSEELLKEWAGCPAEMVSGNNDFFSDLEKEKEITIGKYKVLLTHGHYYGVSLGTEQLKKEAKARGIDIAMFGHTHRPVIDAANDLVVLNPGSLSYPRQDDRRPSYVIMDLDDQGEVHFTINYIEKEKRRIFY